MSSEDAPSNDNAAKQKTSGDGDRDRPQLVGRHVTGRVGNQFLLRGVQTFVLLGQPVGGRCGSVGRLVHRLVLDGTVVH
jgi:hypothetical protein